MGLVERVGRRVGAGADMSDVRWTEAGRACSARWRSESGAAPPARGVAAGDGLTADAACRMAREGQGILWRGDFQNARKLLQAMGRRLDGAPARTFQEHRLAQATRAQLLGMLLLPFEADHRVPLRRAPDVRHACMEVYGAAAEPYVASLRELQGLIGAHEWRKKGVDVPALGARIHPHYGVFAPVRGEYAGLVAKAPLPSKTSAFDIGTGTGVLAALLGRRGVQGIVATDVDPRAVACARENLDRLGLAGIETRQGDLFPEGRAALVVCNPPWIPAPPTSSLENAIYDPESRMLRAFLAGLAGHLEAEGEGWLILSDLAEHLGLRSRAELLAWIEAGGLQVAGRIDARPEHPRARDAADPLHAARAAEITSLWRLRAR
jgi:methylase of polypeptide subunit release factors